jgi:hypothetical protein
MASPSQDARHLGEESEKPRAMVRGLDLDHRVEEPVGEGQLLGVTLDEIQAGHVVDSW